MNAEQKEIDGYFTDEEIALKYKAIESRSVNTGINIADFMNGQEEDAPAVCYIELNNWFCGEDYPANGKLKEYVETNKFSSDKWCKENNLCVLVGVVDMSVNWCITAPAKWVEENCPELLGDGEYTYEVHIYRGGEKRVVTHKQKYREFLRYEEDGVVSSRFGASFLEYSKENIGVTTCEYGW